MKDWEGEIEKSITKADGFEEVTDKYLMLISPYYATLAEQSEALKKQAWPDMRELDSKYAQDDPLAEEQYSVCRALIHRNADRCGFDGLDRRSEHG